MAPVGNSKMHFNNQNKLAPNGNESFIPIQIYSAQINWFRLKTAVTSNFQFQFFKQFINEFHSYSATETVVSIIEDRKSQIGFTRGIKNLNNSPGKNYSSYPDIHSSQSIPTYVTVERNTSEIYFKYKAFI